MKTNFRTEDSLPSNPGYCPACRRSTVFTEQETWLRDHYLCRHCHSIPRQRHLTIVLDLLYPQWDQLIIHESSPSNGLLGQFCPQYSYSQYFPDVERGIAAGGVRCEDIEHLTFTDSSLDVFITQDVLEHVFDPAAALREIHRVIKPGGAHIFTTPKHKTLLHSQRRAALTDHGEVNHLLDAQYHGNPVGDGKALVTWDFGCDFEHLVSQWIKESAITYQTVDRTRGIDAEFNEVFVIRRS